MQTPHGANLLGGDGGLLLKQAHAIAHVGLCGRSGGEKALQVILIDKEDFAQKERDLAAPGAIASVGGWA